MSTKTNWTNQELEIWHSIAESYYQATQLYEREHTTHYPAFVVAEGPISVPPSLAERTVH